MASTAASAVEMIPQLEAARKLALSDPQVYNQVLPGILPIIGPTAPVEVRRWGAEFLAEGFASPSLSNLQKEQLTSEVLPTLRSMLDAPNGDSAIIRSVIQAAASIYALVFRRIISHPDEVSVWQNIMAMKENILLRMDSAPMPIRICCIKFVQKVVQVETPGLIADPRRPDQNETSISLVPRNHPLLNLQILEAEASGLLDRLLAVFQEDLSDPIVIDATLNCLAILIRTRPAISNKILSAILNFNPLKQASTSMSPRSVVILKSMERTTRALLRNVLRTMPNSPMESKIQGYLMRLQQTRVGIFSEGTSLKRAAEPSEGYNDVKRQRLSGEPRKYPAMPPPPNSFAHLFTLTEDPMIQQFDVKLLPIDIVSTVSAVLLQHVDSAALEEAVNVIRGRYVHLKKASMPTPVPDVPMAGPTGIDDEDDYDPEFVASAEAIVSPATEKALEELVQPAIDLGPFELPKPSRLTDTEVAVLSDQTVGHVFELIRSFDYKSQAVPRAKLGLNRLAASANDRDAWATILIRLATRSSSGLNDVVASMKYDGDGSMVKDELDADETELPTLANRIRQTLFMYILDDFRARLNVAISWLTEEWYADKLRAKKDGVNILPNYNRWTLRLIDRLLPYLDARDKNVLIRFLSEVPAIDRDMLDRVKTLSRDPERISMCILALQYLLLMRPPARTLVVDTIEEIWREGDPQAKSATAKVLTKWRPGVLDDANPDVKLKEESQDRKTLADSTRNGLVAKSVQSPGEQESYDPRKRMTGTTPQMAVTAGGGDV